MEKLPESCSKQHFLISPSRIHLLRFILEAYEGIALVTTLDARLGLVELSVAPGCEQEVARIMDSEAPRLQLRQVGPQPGTCPTSTAADDRDHPRHPWSSMSQR